MVQIGTKAKRLVPLNGILGRTISTMPLVVTEKARLWPIPRGLSVYRIALCVSWIGRNSHLKNFSTFGSVPPGPISTNGLPVLVEKIPNHLSFHPFIWPLTDPIDYPFLATFDGKLRRSSDRANRTIYGSSTGVASRTVHVSSPGEKEQKRFQAETRVVKNPAACSGGASCLATRHGNSLVWVR